MSCLLACARCTPGPNVLTQALANQVVANDGALRLSAGLLSIRAPEYGFEVISNEHDGLVTIGEIPKAAQAEARRKSGVRRTVLARKPFC